ncbi:MAG: PD-(D/E)XK nuclease family protein [Bacteroidota bacterium]
MQTFLSKVAGHFLNQNIELDNHIFVLPNNRSKFFLKNEFIKSSQEVSFLPRVWSLEEFINSFSKVKKLDNISLLFEFYDIYKQNNLNKNIEPIDDFSKWAQTLLHDFNDIDINLSDTNDIFDYLIDTKRLEKLFLTDKDQTEITKNYFQFIENIKYYHQTLYNVLKTKGTGYQGLVYREAINDLTEILKTLEDKKIAFVGFNALNRAEEKIITEILSNTDADIFWDADNSYLKLGNSAGTFMRKYKDSWKYFDKKEFNWPSANLYKPKNVEIIGASKIISQVKYASEILLNLQDKENDYQNTALILADENLLPVVLNSLPETVKNVNITMGYPLKSAALTSLFDLLFKLYLNRKNFKDESTFYFKDLVRFINIPFLNNLFDLKIFKKEIEKFIEKNVIEINLVEIETILNKITIPKTDLTFIFRLKENEVDENLNKIIQFIDILRVHGDLSYLDKENLFRFKTIFEQLHYLNNKNGFIVNFETLYHLYKQLLQTENLSFRGEPLRGLQIMGMLESRVLDFENIIILSVNEGILPVGKTQNSFIPFDIKIKYNLPTYKEKDAIYAYHFYRLIQRAKNTFILYNSEAGNFGTGEQSRFVTQIEIAKETGALPNLRLTKKIINQKAGSDFKELYKIDKTPSVIEKLKNFNDKNGFSPSALTSYIRNPIDFYKRRILGIKDRIEIEESAAFNTFGTIVHDSLENLYKPVKGAILTETDIRRIKKLADKEVKIQFGKHFSPDSITKGKNRLNFEVAKKYVFNQLEYDLKEILKGKKIRIIDLEKSVHQEIKIDSLDFPIKLIGKIDRIDECDGTLRIIDYKTGKTEEKNLKVKDWDELSTNYEFSKAFQVLMYALMYLKETSDVENMKVETGIISFKNLSKGFIRFNDEINHKKEFFLHKSDLDNFNEQLENLLIEIFAMEIPFEEKMIKQFKF